MSSAICFNLVQSKSLSSGTGLRYLTTKFIIVQIENISSHKKLKMWFKCSDSFLYSLPTISNFCNSEMAAIKKQEKWRNAAF